MLRAVEAGAEAVLIRDRDLSEEAYRDYASRIKLKVGRRAALVASHRLEAAAVLGLDGVQFGTKDGDPEKLLSQLPPGLQAGFSCHSVEEALLRERQGYRWVFLGPVFATPEKLKYGDPLGLEVVHQAVERLSIPVVFIGGINRNTIEPLVAAGARRVAAIRAFMGPHAREEIAAVRSVLAT